MCVNKPSGLWEISSVGQRRSSPIIDLFRLFAGDGARLRDQAIQFGVIKPLVDYLAKDIPISFLRNITWVIVNLCRHKDTPVSFDAVRQILPALKCLLSHSDTTVSTVVNIPLVSQQPTRHLDSRRLYMGPCLSTGV